VIPLPVEAVAHATAWALISSLWQNALIAGFALLLLASVPRAAAHARYAIACCCMAAMIAVPVMTGVRSYRTFTREAVAVGPALQSDDSPAAAWSAAQRVPAAAIEVTPARQPRAAEARGGLELRGWLRDLVLSLWLAGLAVHLIRLSVGLRQTYRLTFTATAAPPLWLAALARDVGQRLRTRLSLVRVSARASVPMVIGIVRPVILVPLSFVTGLPPDALRALLAHELAHVRRHDFLVNLLQVMAESLLFYHPATWWLSRRIRDERENCCDDVASQALDGRRDLALALVAAEELRRSRAPALALAATDGSLAGRIHRLLAPVPRTRSGSLAAAAVIPLLSVVLVLPATAVRETERTPAGQWREIWSGTIPPGAWLRAFNLHGPVVVERQPVARAVVFARASSPDLRFRVAADGGSGGVMVCAMLPAFGECNADGMIWRGTPGVLRGSVTELHVVLPLDGAVEAAAHEGTLTLEGGTGPVVARTGAGRVVIAGGASSIEAASGAGAISITGGRDVVVRSSNGDVALNEVAGDAQVRTTNGSVRARLAPGKPERNVDVVIGTGSASLHLPAGVDATLAARADDGRVEVAYPGLDRVSERARDQEHHAIIGRGGGTMRIATGRGDITVTARR
jgi:beta-lactamase regulating signal transducer with metallopeptidase domain